MKFVVYRAFFVYLFARFSTDNVILKPIHARLRSQEFRHNRNANYGHSPIRFAPLPITTLEIRLLC